MGPNIKVYPKQYTIVTIYIMKVVIIILINAHACCDIFDYLAENIAHDETIRNRYININ